MKEKYCPETEKAMQTTAVFELLIISFSTMKFVLDFPAWKGNDKNYDLFNYLFIILISVGSGNYNINWWKKRKKRFHSSNKKWKKIAKKWSKTKVAFPRLPPLLNNHIHKNKIAHLHQQSSKLHPKLRAFCTVWIVQEWSKKSK